MALNITVPVVSASQLEGYAAQLNVTNGDLVLDDTQASSWTAGNTLDSSSLFVPAHFLVTLSDNYTATIFPPVYTNTTQLTIQCGASPTPGAYWNLSSSVPAYDFLTWTGESCDGVLSSIGGLMPTVNLTGQANASVTLGTAGQTPARGRVIVLEELYGLVTVNGSSLLDFDWSQCPACPIRFQAKDGYNAFQLRLVTHMNHTILPTLQIDSPAQADVISQAGGTISLLASQVKFDTDGRFLIEEGLHQGIYCLNPQQQCTDNYWSDVTILGAYPCITSEEAALCNSELRTYLDTPLPITCDIEPDQGWMLHINSQQQQKSESVPEYNEAWYLLTAAYYLSVVGIVALSFFQASLSLLCWAPVVVASLMLKTNGGTWDTTIRDLVDTANNAVTKLSFVGWYCGAKTEDTEILYRVWLSCAGFVVLLFAVRFVVVNSNLNLPSWRPIRFLRNKLNRGPRQYGGLESALKDPKPQSCFISRWSAENLGEIYARFCRACLMLVVFLLAIPVLFHIQGPLDQTEGFFVVLLLVFIALLFCVDRAGTLHGTEAQFEIFETTADSSGGSFVSDDDSGEESKLTEFELEAEPVRHKRLTCRGMVDLLIRGVTIALLVLPLFVLAVLAHPSLDNGLDDTGFTSTVMGLVFVQQLALLFYHYHLLRKAFGKERIIAMVFIVITIIGLDFVALCMGVLFVASLCFWSQGNNTLGIWLAWAVISAFSSMSVMIIQSRPDVWCCTLAHAVKMPHVRMPHRKKKQQNRENTALFPNREPLLQETDGGKLGESSYIAPEVEASAIEFIRERNSSAGL